MRIPDWSPDKKPQPQELVDAIVRRRGGELLNLDRALLWSTPVAVGWNGFLGNVRTQLSIDPKLRELGICTVALLTGASYEYHHHAPEFLAAGGTKGELDAVQMWTANPGGPLALAPKEALVVRYAREMTVNVKVDDVLFSEISGQFETTEVVELTTTIAAYNMVARVLLALGVTPETA